MHEPGAGVEERERVGELEDTVLDLEFGETEVGEMGGWGVVVTRGRLRGGGGGGGSVASTLGAALLAKGGAVVEDIRERREHGFGD